MLASFVDSSPTLRHRSCNYKEPNNDPLEEAIATIVTRLHPKAFTLDASMKPDFGSPWGINQDSEGGS